jgi:hypothetical protein
MNSETFRERDAKGVAILENREPFLDIVVTNSRGIDH